MITPEELIQDLIDFYGYEVDLSYAINYIDIVGQYAEVDSFHLWVTILFSATPILSAVFQPIK